MVERFCPGCGFANALAAEFCKRCGLPLATLPSDPPEDGGDPTGEDTPPPTGTERTPEPSPKPPAKRAGPILLVLALALLTIAAAFSLTVVVDHGRLPTLWSPSPSPPGGHPTARTVEVADVHNRTVQPGPSQAIASPLVAPNGSAGIAVGLNLSAAGCPPVPLPPCGLSVAVVTPANWSAFVGGHALTALWCDATTLGLCPTFLDLHLRFGIGDANAGRGLELVVWNPGLVPLSGGWDAQLHYTTAA
ncbi:MAG: hypothetical protein L3K07_00880 [Thermoplasmata archaeon]|nr:hypothetical protein [Thermoplasmata archaeon]